MEEISWYDIENLVEGEVHDVRIGVRDVADLIEKLQLELEIESDENDRLKNELIEVWNRLDRLEDELLKLGGEVVKKAGSEHSHAYTPEPRYGGTYLC